MKKILFLFVFSFFIYLTKANAQNDSMLLPAKVYVIRATGNDGALVNFRVLVNDMIYCKISNNRYSIIDIKPGQYTFYVTNWAQPKQKPKLGLDMQLEAGKTYYLRMVVKKRFLEDPLYFEEITYNSAAPLLAKYKQDTDCDR